MPKKRSDRGPKSDSEAIHEMWESDVRAGLIDPTKDREDTTREEFGPGPGPGRDWPAGLDLDKMWPGGPHTFSRLEPVAPQPRVSVNFTILPSIMNTIAELSHRWGISRGKVVDYMVEYAARVMAESRESRESQERSSKKGKRLTR